MNIHCSWAECFLRLGDILRSHGNLLAAIKHWDNARPLFERSSQTKQIEAIDESLASVEKDVLNAPNGIIVEQMEENLFHIEDL